MQRLVFLYGVSCIAQGYRKGYQCHGCTENLHLRRAGNFGSEPHRVFIEEDFFKRQAKHSR